MDKKEKRKVITDIIVIAIFVLLCGLRLDILFMSLAMEPI